MTKVNIGELKTHFSAYARRVKQGETVIVCDRNQPFGELRPLQDGAPPLAPRRRILGGDRGRVSLPPDWDSPETNQAVAALFGIDA